MTKLKKLFLNRAVDQLRLRYDSSKDGVELFFLENGHALIRKEGVDTLIPPGNILYMELESTLAPVKTGGCAGCGKKAAKKA